MESKIKPLFVFSMPRSGSTLLQKILSSHSKISTKPETWFLLPLLYMTKDKGVLAEYGYSKFRNGFEDFKKDLINYKYHLSDFVLNNYVDSSDSQAAYFLDKTPRYSLICDNIIDLFDDAKFIFLWRNPLSVASSMIESWGKGQWNIYKYEIDLYDGLKNLIDTYKNSSSNVLGIKYENMVDDPKNTMDKIFDFLGLEYHESLLNEFTKIDFHGKMGDQTGTLKYKEISKESVESWTKTFSNPIRKNWAYRYLKSIDSEDLRLIGYDKPELYHKIKKSKNKINFHILNDMYFIVYGGLKNIIQKKLLKK